MALPFYYQTHRGLLKSNSDRSGQLGNPTLKRRITTAAYLGDRRLLRLEIPENAWRECTNADRTATPGPS